MESPKIIGLSAQLQNGKDTVASLIMKLTSKEYGGYLGSNWSTRRFAGKLKQMTAILLGCSVDDLEDINYKNSELPDEWNRWTMIDPGLVGSMGENDIGKVCPYFSTEQEVYDYINEKDWFWLKGLKATCEKMTPRKILQLLGTEGGRDVIHPNIWVNATLGDITDKDYVIITDARFPNEVVGIKKKKGIVVRIIRPSVISDSTHPSEISLNDFKDWDYVIVNDGTIEELEIKVKEMLNHFNLL